MGLKDVNSNGDNVVTSNLINVKFLFLENRENLVQN
jgi:hypothetical protein